MENMEEFLDWFVSVGFQHYKTTPSQYYTPDSKSHFFLPGSAERFSSKEMVGIWNHTSDKETYEKWLSAIASSLEFIKRNAERRD